MTAAKRRILKDINRLALSRVRIATHRLNRICDACACPITANQEYRDAGTLKTHDYCFQAMAREFQKGRS